MSDGSIAMNTIRTSYCSGRGCGSGVGDARAPQGHRGGGDGGGAGGATQHGEAELGRSLQRYLSMWHCDGVVGGGGGEHRREGDAAMAVLEENTGEGEMRRWRCWRITPESEEERLRWRCWRRIPYRGGEDKN